MTERDPGFGVRGPGDTGEAFEHLADVADLPEDSVLGVRRTGGEAVCLYNCGGRIHAVPDCCTHAEFPLSEGYVRNGTLECVWHGALFDCATGAVRRGPAVDPLPRYEVRVEDGRVLVGPRRK